ncbi:hypothetical protein ZYGR_0H03840 [Zygosaccharomyces rouxii]|uniref:ZYRO0B12782p n=2 Tax=Zygosaccharomyces rouxii TaxID=4956 RepID=C5DS05_ZYGRC|nr:uncharacterized protein ZYRO0B12782g [Zygosaccharomyces rouxii]KAH9199905.1 hypothetical protein LQ764DRAFT_234503 [Zygosaccharomyces rouxii]GAV47538.1 hypothetical protein ZYGR_0H03840 [Zygosaccharomyces rouxii]CAR26566.1 ZYRO0B12782p [Zygosaccharomyces rouxii]
MDRLGDQVGSDTRLFQALNGFILLIGNDSQQQPQREQAINEHPSSKVDSKTVANYLRLKLLSYLRQLQLQNTVTPHRDALIQWWVTLLNFLNSDLVDRNSPVEEMVFPDPLLSVDSISVTLECVSRLMSSLMVLPIHSCKDAEIYSHHVLLTIHYVTNRLILNSKHQREITKQQQQQHHITLPQHQQHFNRSILHFLSSYTSLLRSFLGKLNAYAFFYLPDDFHYDVQLLLALKPNLSYKPANSLFLWKRRSFGSIENQEDRIKPETLENRDTNFFKIVISYMKNDFIFMAFYWHYWYIALRFLANLNGGSELKSNLSMIPGANVLITHVTSGFLRIDLARFTKFLQSNNNINGMGFSRSDSTDSLSTNGLAASAAANVNANANASAGVGENGTVTAEILNDFLFSNFRILRVWECLRNLSGCLEKDSNLPVLLLLHDSSQLRYISSIPAHDSGVANVIYNKVFQFIIFQFRSLSSVQFLHWDIWFAGICAMLQTLNNNAQTVALLFLFNVWPHIPANLQSMLSQKLINDYWNFLTFENDFQLVRVLFLKLLVFRVIPGSALTVKEQLKMKFQDFYAEMLILKCRTREEPLRDKEDDLYFYGSKRLFLAPNRLLKEQDLIYRAEKHSHPKSSGRYQNFPTVSSVANVRPSLILRNGRYPYDVFDEMVTKASLLMTERKRKEQNSLSTISSASTHSHSDNNLGQSKHSSKKTGSFSNTISSWFSKLSKNSEHSQSNNADISMQKHAPFSNSGYIKGERSKYLVSDESVPYSESSEMLSMYSNVSSIGTRRTSSSEVPQASVMGASFTQGSSASSGKEIDAGGYSRDNQKKKKLLAPAELKYSSSVIDTGEIYTIFKVKVTQAEPIGKKVEYANSNWGVVTAKTYDKPLPVPTSPSSESSAVSSVIDELNNDSFGVDYLNESSFELLPPPQEGNSKSNESTLMSAYSNDPTVPKPNCRFFGMQNSEDSDVSTGDSEILNRFQNLTLGENEDVEEDEKAILKGLDRFDEEIIASRRRALHYNRHNCLKTRLNKLSKLVRMFNKTVEEYYEYLNFLDHDMIFMDFEIRPPSHANMMNVSAD